MNSSEYGEVSDDAMLEKGMAECVFDLGSCNTVNGFRIFLSIHFIKAVIPNNLQCVFIKTCKTRTRRLIRRGILGSMKQNTCP